MVFTLLTCTVNFFFPSSFQLLYENNEEEQTKGHKGAVSSVQVLRRTLARRGFFFFFVCSAVFVCRQLSARNKMNVDEYDSRKKKTDFEISPTKKRKKRSNGPPSNPGTDDVHLHN